MSLLLHWSAILSQDALSISSISVSTLTTSALSLIVILNSLREVNHNKLRLSKRQLRVDQTSTLQYNGNLNPNASVLSSLLLLAGQQHRSGYPSHIRLEQLTQNKNKSLISDPYEIKYFWTGG